MVRRSRPVVSPIAIAVTAFAMSLSMPVLAAKAPKGDPLAEWKTRMAAHENAAKRAGSAAERDGEIHQMDQLLQQCGQTRGCEIAALLPIYKDAVAAVKAGTDVEIDDDGPDEMIDVATDGKAATATADKLLDERNRRFMDMVKMNPGVQAGIRKWLTDMRPSLMRSYENFQYLKNDMLPAFQRNGLSEALLFGIVAKESNGKVHVGSRVGAVGPLQFMPATGRRFGLGPDGAGFDTRYDPKMSSEAAAAYLHERFSELNNSIELSLAAYNGGEGRALRIYNGSGGRNFWDADVYSQFPAETRDYVPMVIAAAWLYLHPREYGVRFPRVSDSQSQIRLQRPTSFNEMTICMGNARGTDGYLRALRNMNPRYSPTQWIPAGTALNATSAMSRAYSWNCVSGKRADLARELANADVRSAIVQVGNFETIEGDKPAGSDGPAGTARDPAMQVQPATRGATGVPAAMPSASTNAGATSAGAAMPAQKAASTSRTAAPSAAAKAAPAARAQPPRPTTYRVRDGENLTQIARESGCRLSALIEANGLKAPNYTVRPGQLLKMEGCGN